MEKKGHCSVNWFGFETDRIGSVQLVDLMVGC
jgi:hypothetical protein